MNKPTKKISRRDAIKLLGAITGATILANLPSKWSTPEMVSGVLPAHAQTSGSRTLAAGASDPDANYCFPLTSTVVITPIATGILMRYTIVTSGTVTISSPLPTGTVATNASGVATLNINIDTSAPFDVGDIITVTWSFENPADGVGSSAQVFTSGGSGC